MPFFKKLYQKNRNKKTQRENQSVFYFYGCRIHQSGCILSKTKTPSRTFCVRDGVVPVVGVEPTRCCHQRILSPSRLPIPTHRHLPHGKPMRYFLLYSKSLPFASLFADFLRRFRKFFAGNGLARPRRPVAAAPGGQGGCFKRSAYESSSLPVYSW